MYKFPDIIVFLAYVFLGVITVGSYAVGYCFIESFRRK